MIFSMCTPDDDVVLGEEEAEKRLSIYYSNSFWRLHYSEVEKICFRLCSFHSIFLPRNGSFAVDVRTISNAISCPIFNCGKGKKDRKHLIVKTFRCKYLRKLIFYSDWLLWDRNWIFLNEEYFDCLFVFGNGRTSYNQRCGYWHGIILMKWSE